MVYKFEEIRNDLMDYFILGDPELLLQFKNSRNLPDDLITEFTTKPTIDEAVEQGVMIPMCGVENYLYNIILALILHLSFPNKKISYSIVKTDIVYTLRTKLFAYTQCLHCGHLQQSRFKG